MCFTIRVWFARQAEPPHMLPLGLWGTAPSGTVSSVAGRLMSTGPRWLILIEKPGCPRRIPPFEPVVRRQFDARYPLTKNGVGQLAELRFSQAASVQFFSRLQVGRVPK